MTTTLHTLRHALNPAEAECRCDRANIRECVICGRTLSHDRSHVDTCGKRHYQGLLVLQRGQSS